MATGIVALKPYFRARLNELKYTEWKDAFTFDNIPSTMIDRAYHLEFPRGARIDAYDMKTSDISQDVVVRVFFKGFRNSGNAVDLALIGYDEILASVLSSANRIGVDIKNVYFDSMQLLPLSASNGNAAILELTFSCLIITCI